MAFLVSAGRNLVSNLVGRLSDPITLHITYLFKLDANLYSLRREMGELKNISEDVKMRVEEEEERQFSTPTNQVRWWLQQVQLIEVEVTQIEESYQGEPVMMRTRFWDCIPNCLSSYTLGKRVAKALGTVSELKSKASFDVVAQRSRPAVVEEMQSTSTVGRDLALEKALMLLGEDGVGILGIYGMGGVGKTTLLKKMNNYFNEAVCDFDVVIWVEVSRNGSLEKIQENIGDRLHLSLPENETSLGGRAKHLFKVLKKNKCLLLLDDVWDRLNLEAIGIPSPKTHKVVKIVFTTRSKDVCTDLHADRSMKVDFMTENDAWELFSKYVGGEGVVDSPLIQPIAKKVAQKCGGLPLALITIGRAMANKTTVEEWRHAETTLRKSPAKLRGVENEILSLLKFSYDSLPNATLKSCFLYCSLIPKHVTILTGDMITYWIGEGFLDEYDDIYEAFDMGFDIIGRLKVACLLEGELSQKETFFMHDMIRELGLWIACDCGKKKDKFLVEVGVGLTVAPGVDRWIDAERISLMAYRINALTETPTCPNLLTFLIPFNLNLNNVCSGFFQFMPLLRVLELSYTNLQVLPADISYLVELRYLGLSGTKIRMLPKEVWSLVKLKCLDLSDTLHLEAVSLKGIVGHLNLQVLKLNDSSYCDWNETNLAALEGCRRLNVLGITISTDHTLKRFLGSQILPSRTHALCIKNCSGPTSIRLSSYQRMKHLKSLSIVLCVDLEELKLSEVEGESFHSSLLVLNLGFLPKLKVITMPPHKCLENLSFLQIVGCDELKNITWVLLLQNLETLILHGCSGMELVIGVSSQVVEEEQTTLSRLKVIQIKELPELKSICCHALFVPCLKELTVINCPKLKRIPLRPNNASQTYPEFVGHKAWWDGLEWEDDSIKSTFLPNFLKEEDDGMTELHKYFAQDLGSFFEFQ